MDQVPGQLCIDFHTGLRVPVLQSAEDDRVQIGFIARELARLEEVPRNGWPPSPVPF
jgi:hypothetical protein